MSVASSTCEIVPNCSKVASAKISVVRVATGQEVVKKTNSSRSGKSQKTLF